MGTAIKLRQKAIYRDTVDSYIHTYIYICVIHLNIGICASSMSWRDPTLSVRDL